MLSYIVWESTRHSSLCSHCRSWQKTPIFDARKVRPTALAGAPLWQNKPAETLRSLTSLWPPPLCLDQEEENSRTHHLPASQTASWSTKVQRVSSQLPQLPTTPIRGKALGKINCNSSHSGKQSLQPGLQRWHSWNLETVVRCYNWSSGQIQHYRSPVAQPKNHRKCYRSLYPFWTEFWVTLPNSVQPEQQQGSFQTSRNLIFNKTYTTDSSFVLFLQVSSFATVTTA